MIRLPLKPAAYEKFSIYLKECSAEALLLQIIESLPDNQEYNSFLELEYNQVARVSNERFNIALELTFTEEEFASIVWRAHKTFLLPRDYFLVLIGLLLAGEIQLPNLAVIAAAAMIMADAVVA